MAVESSSIQINSFINTQLSQQTVGLLGKDHVRSIELKEHLENRTKDLQRQLDKLNQTTEQLQDKIKEAQQAPSEEVEVGSSAKEDLTQEEKELDELAQQLTKPENAIEISQEAQQTVKEFIQQE